MSSDLVDLIDAIAVVDGTVSMKRLEISESEILATKIVWSYRDHREPQTVIRFGDATFRPKGAQDSITIDTGSPEFDFELKAMLLLLYHIGKREGTIPYKWATAASRIRTLSRLAHYCFDRGYQSFRNLDNMSPIRMRTLLLEFLSADEMSGGMNVNQWTSAARNFRDAVKHLADYGVVQSRQLIPLIDEITRDKIRKHDAEHHLRHSVIPTLVMKELIAQASAYVIRAEQQYCRLAALMTETDVALTTTRCRGRNIFGRSNNLRAYKELSELLRDFYVDLRRHVYVLVLAFTGMRDGEVNDLKTSSSGVRIEAGGPVYYVKSLLSKGDDEVIELDWIANSITHEAISLLSRINCLFYQKSHVILAHHRDSLTDKQIYGMESGIQEKKLFGVRCVATGFSFFIWTSKASDGQKSVISFRRYVIRMTARDVDQLNKLECNYRSVSSGNGMRGKPYSVGDSFNFTPHQFRHTFAWFIVGNRLGDIDDIRYQFKHLTQAMTLVYSERGYQTLDELRAAIEYFETLMNKHAIDDIVTSADKGRIAGGGGERLVLLLHKLNDGSGQEQFSTADQPHFRNRSELIKYATRHGDDIRGLPHGYCTKGASCKIKNSADPSHCLYCDNYFSTEKHLPYWHMIEKNCSSSLQAINEMPMSAQKQFMAYRQTLEDNLFAARGIIKQLAPSGEVKKGVQ